MKGNSRQDAYQSLVSLAEKQGYVTFDNIMDCADDYSLPIQDFDWLTNAITTRRVLIYSENPSSQNIDDGEYDDFAQSDYEAVYRRIIELSPNLEPFVEAVRNIVPPQYGEINRLKYQIVDGNLHARNRMIEMHLRIALKIALGRAETYDNDIEETIGDACMGLIHAVDKYNPDTSGPFASYASLWVLQNLSRSQGTRRPLIYYPVYRKEEYITVYPIAKAHGCIGCVEMSTCRKIRKFIKEKLNCSISDAELVISQMVPFENLQDMLELVEMDNYRLHDATSTGLFHHLSYEIEDIVLEKITIEHLKEILETALATLKPKEADVICMRYGLSGDEMTLEEIGKRYNLTRERIRQIELKALKKLREIQPLKELFRYNP